MDIKIIFRDSILSVDRAIAFAEIWCWRFLFESEEVILPREESRRVGSSELGSLERGESVVCVVEKRSAKRVWAFGY